MAAMVRSSRGLFPRTGNYMNLRYFDGRCGNLWSAVALDYIGIGKQNRYVFFIITPQILACPYLCSFSAFPAGR
jgi:hypothetical protein